MSIATDVIRENHYVLYQELDRVAQSAEQVLQDYMDKATALWNELPDPADKADIVAHRDALKLRLQTILNNN